MRSGWPVAQKSAAVRRSHGQLFANAVRTIKAAGSKLQGNTSFPISHCSQCLPWETVRNTDAEVIEHLAKFSTFKIQFQTIGLHPLLVTGIESAGFTAVRTEITFFPRPRVRIYSLFPIEIDVSYTESFIRTCYLRS